MSVLVTLISVGFADRHIAVPSPVSSGSGIWCVFITLQCGVLGLIAFVLSQGYDYREAVDGLEGVQTFETEGRFEYGNTVRQWGASRLIHFLLSSHSVVLVDLSMPILDGVAATARMREIESKRKNESSGSATHPARILALTGMSSLEDKRRAFEAGVDG